MGTSCRSWGCKPKIVVDEKESSGVIFFRNSFGIPRNVLVDDFGESIDKIARRNTKPFTSGVQRAVSRSVPMKKRNEKESFYKKSFYEDFLDTSCTTSRPHYISNNLEKVRAEKVHSSGGLQPPVTPVYRHIVKRTTSNPSRNQIYSNWADAFEEFDSSHYSSIVYGLQTDDTMFSENDGISLQDHSVSTPTTVFTSAIVMPIEPGMVLAMYLTNDGHQFKQLNLDMSLEDVVSTFLSRDNKIKLPVSITEPKKAFPMIMERNQMVKSIAENVGPYFDVKTQGLIFSTGLVNSKLCHKVCLGDLGQMQKILSLDSKVEFHDE